MHSIHRPLWLLLALLLPATALAATTQLTLLHMGDLHGHLVPHPNLRSDGNGLMQGGLARLHGQIQAIRADHPHTLLINTGDTIQGSAEALFTRGEALVEALNPLAIDAFAPGNWDFVYGTERFIELFVGDAPKAPWGALAANLYYAAGDADGQRTRYVERAGERVLPPYRIVTLDGIRLGIIGMTTDRGPQAVGRNVAAGLRFTDGDRELAELLPKLREEERVDAVILISELGLANNLRLADKHPGIDLVLSSDMHELTREPITLENGTLLVEEGQDGSVLGQFDLTFVDGRLTERRWSLHTIDAQTPEEPATAARVAALRAPFVSGAAFTPHTNPINQSRLTTPIDSVVGYTKVPLLRANFSHERMPAVIEGSSHDLLTDAFRAEAHADIGAIRGFRYGTQVAPGPIHLEDLYHFMPIGAQIAVGTIRGQDLLDQIEASADSALNPSIDEWRGGSLFGYSGVEIELSPYKPRGRRAVAVRVNGEPLEPRRLYRYASYWFAADPELIKRLPARGVQVLKQADGSPLDATELVARYLQGLPEQTADPKLDRVQLTAPLPAQPFSYGIMQPLLGAAIPGVEPPTLTIDIPLELTHAKVLFNIGEPKFDGDQPSGLKFMGKLAQQLGQDGTEYRIIGIFKGDALYQMLNDRSYNRIRKTRDGNPYREQILELQRLGVEFEACGNTMRTRGFGNADLLPGVKVNRGAIGRTLQLVQEGFIQLDD